MKINYEKTYRAIQCGFKLPRKTKKQFFGPRPSIKELKKKLTEVEFKNDDDWPGSGPQILPNPFCPQCGCTSVRVVNHRVEYPERWIDIFCARCGFMVERSDNSRFYHCLEFPQYNYRLT